MVATEEFSDQNTDWLKEKGANLDYDSLIQWVGLGSAYRQLCICICIFHSNYDGSNMSSKKINK